MKIFLLAVILMSGCAVRATTNPTEWESCLLYCRITNCTAQDVPKPLEPSTSDNVTPLLPKAPPNVTAEEGKIAVSGDSTHCTTLEVGAKSYSDTIAALGLALAGIYAKVHGWIF